MTTTPSPTRTVRTPRSSSSYTELAATVRASGLMRRRLGFYWGRIVTAVLALAGLVAAVVLLGDSWWQLALAGALGVLVTQFGYLGHDAAHRQIFASAAWNDVTARLASGLFAGLSHTWWKGKHDRHHSGPNQEGRDPDIAPGVLGLTADVAARRTSGARGWFQDHQGWLLFPLLTLEGLNLHVASIRTLVGPDSGHVPTRHRRAELALVVARLVLPVVGLLWLLPPGKAAAFVAVQLAVFGICLGGTFLPNHTGMPIVPATSRLDFLHRQVLMSRNIRGGWWTDLAMGGLNLQVEHHLFPSMPRPNLRLVQPLVRAHCTAHGVPYTESGLVASYVTIVGHLNHVGLRARGPFDCPLAADLRAG